MEFRWIRLYWPAIVAFVAGMVSAVVVANLPDPGPLRPVVDLVRWVPILFFAAALARYGWATYRLSQAERGEGPICPHCGGPLGGEINGRYGPYRKCLLCGVNANERYWR